MKLQVGQMAPGFELPDQDNNMHSLEGSLGEWVLLYFYPEDDTPGCTIEACEIRDNLPKFQNIGAEVFGISTDSVESHKKFAQKHGLPFTLLADEDGKVSESYGVARQGFNGKNLRSSFLIDQEGRIAKIYEKVDPAVHAQEVLKDIQLM
jgi:peroxiredoxin Q/BCP